MLLARHKEENSLYAVKVVNKSFVVRRNEARHMMSERNVLLKNKSNPFLVELKYSFQTSGRLYFVMDFINGGEVSDAEKLIMMVAMIMMTDMMTMMATIIITISILRLF